MVTTVIFLHTDFIIISIRGMMILEYIIIPFKSTKLNGIIILPEDSF